MKRNVWSVVGMCLLGTTFAGATAAAEETLMPASAAGTGIAPSVLVPKIPPQFSAPTVLLNNSYDACKQFALAGTPCLAKLAEGALTATLRWRACTGIGCVKNPGWFKIYRLPRTSSGGPILIGSAAAALVGTTVQPRPATPPDPNAVPAGHVLVASGAYGSKTEGSGIFFAHTTAALLTTFQKGDCFVARVSSSATGPQSPDSAKVCVDDSVKWGTLTYNAKVTARQQRQATLEGCNANAGKTLISPHDFRVGTQLYTAGSCNGSWIFWSLYDWDLRDAKMPVVKAELVQDQNASCVRRLEMINQNWEPDNGSVSTNRPYAKLKSRDIPGSASLLQDVTEWVNERGRNITGFQFSRGTDTSSCLGNVGGVQLKITQLK